MNGIRWCAAALVMCLQAPSAHAETIAGVAKLLDGDTISIQEQRVRLLHIDAPETDQVCQDDRARAYLCGKDAADYLRKLMRGQKITCVGSEYDRYDRLLAVCRTSRVELNREMVRAGLAVRYDPEAPDYLKEELAAAKAPRGIWRGSFTLPKDHRAARWQAAKQAAPSGCPIKGNISTRNGVEVRIYHTPWSRYYDKTRINTRKGERWFCSESEALTAGWRAPYR